MFRQDILMRFFFSPVFSENFFFYCALLYFVSFLFQVFLFPFFLKQHPPLSFFSSSDFSLRFLLYFTFFMRFIFALLLLPIFDKFLCYFSTDYKLLFFFFKGGGFLSSNREWAWIFFFFSSTFQFHKFISTLKKNYKRISKRKGLNQFSKVGIVKTYLQSTDMHLFSAIIPEIVHI